MVKASLILSAFILTAIMLTSCVGDTSSKESYTDEVTIGEQIWMTKNLNVDKFRNGDPIPEAKTNEEWRKKGENGQPAWCYYYNGPEYGDRYGKLYNKYAVNDPRGLAPEGWKIPSNEDWQRLFDFLDPSPALQMKSIDYWAFTRDSGPSGNGSNESGFSALPGGYRRHDGIFSRLGYDAYFWSSTEGDEFYAWFVNLSHYDEIRFLVDESSGFYIRCLKD
jgi:uncharacterized protein (TIGR02145 family)